MSQKGLPMMTGLIRKIKQGVAKYNHLGIHL